MANLSLQVRSYYGTADTEAVLLDLHEWPVWTAGWQNGKCAVTKNLSDAVLQCSTLHPRHHEHNLGDFPELQLLLVLLGVSICHS